MWYILSVLNVSDGNFHVHNKKYYRLRDYALTFDVNTFYHNYVNYDKKKLLEKNYFKETFIKIKCAIQLKINTFRKIKKS